MEEEGRLIGNFTGNNVGDTTNIIPRMSLEKLQTGYREVLKYLYTPKNYYARSKTFLKEYKPPVVSTPVRGDYLHAFVQSIIQLGIIGKERVHYWKLIAWTLIHRPKLFPQAITLSIYGYHFRKVCDLIAV